MKPLLPFMFLLALLLSGCGPTLEGRYELRVEMPKVALPQGADPKLQRDLQRQINATMSQAATGFGSFLEFDGREVRMGTGFGSTIHSYRFDGRRLVIEVEGMGQKAEIPMTLEADGSINYMGMRYRRVR